MSAATPAIECRALKKVFGSVIANNHVNLTVNYGEILAILGENGSGKTTLMNMLSGIYKQDEGEIYIDGNLASINSPADSQNLGIGMIHQHFKLIDVFTAFENIIMGTKEKSSRQTKDKIKKMCDEYGLQIELDKKVYDMSVSEKQNVEIVKIISRGAKILILDEPTAVLTPQETAVLFKILGKMRSRGVAIIIITHKLNEVMEISDRVTILRKGESVDDCKTSDVNEKELTELMVGRPISLEIERPEVQNATELLRVVNLTVKAADGATALDDIEFTINSGEILGVAGVAGSGQKELCECIVGLTPVETGAILYKKENLVGKKPKDIINLGIQMSFVPEDRLGMGLVASMSVADNVILKSYDKYSKGPFINKAPARKLSESLVERLEISTPSIDTPVRLLSGGNIQKVLLGREIASAPNLLITAYPVRGLDINSSFTIYDLLNEQKKKGVAVLFIGEDLDVLTSLCDRIMILCHGKITGIVDAKSVTKKDIGLMMTGGEYKNG